LPAPTPPPAPDAAFRVGDRVEIQYRAGEWFPGIVVTVSPGACPSYRVRADVYGRGDPSELTYFCGSVRAPTGIAPPKRACGGSNPNCAPSAPPPLGTYLCHQMVWQGSGAPLARKDHPSLTLLSGNRYRLYDDGAIGRYRYDARTFRLTFTGGDLAGRGPEATYGLDVRAPEITIAFPTEYSRRTGNEPPTWQCGLGR
ncbi:MAG TPA: hypothetical protein VEA99_16070, partial [Gemmatimonadaceae bacterium]|nr:hypothetical protein [Gemmatimonadaceae bacterium]